MSESRRKRLESRRAVLETERSSYIAHWRELNEYVSPRSAKFLITDRNRGNKLNQKIINGSAGLALRTMQAGMMGGITSPARPWFALQTPDPELNEYAPVKSWLYDVTSRMRTVLAKSNFYNTMPGLYRDLGLYGTHAMLALEDMQTTVRFYPVPVGSYMLANSHRLKVDTIIREFTMTVRQMMQRFGKESVSTTVRNLAANGNLEAPIEVVHCIEPNEVYDGSKLDSKFKLYASVYYEKGSDNERCLSEKGFDSFPLLAPRWDLTGEDVYGYSPGMDALGDIKQLQLMEKRKAELVDKASRPPMNAPSSMRNRRSSILPGDVNYVDVNQGQQGFTPAFEINPAAITAVANDIMNIEQRIDSIFYKDLFLMIANDTRSNVTATEIAERHEEKLLMLGPVLERMNDEALSPTIDRVFEIMVTNDMLPPAPEELQEMDLKVEYTSVIAQAQKLVGAASIERFASFAGNMMQAFPDVRYRINSDEMIETYGEIVGTPPKIIIPLEDANQARQADAQKAQAAEAMQMGMSAAQGAELLSKTDTAGDNALAQLMSSMQGAAPA